MTNPTKPDVVLPSAVPTSLVVEDLVEGDGDEAAYVGVALSTGAEFDSSYDRGDPLTFRLGAGQVISGWDRGVRGMREGGRRQLTIPPHMGYGARGIDGVIKPDETLVFVCDLVGVH